MRAPDPDLRRLDTLLRQDLKAFLMKAFFTLNPGERFLDSWHLDALCWHLEQVRKGTIRRLRIEVPPRSLKSVTASVAFPAFLLGHDPTRKIITASYSADLAAKHAADCRAVMRSEWYRRVFPQTRISDGKNQESNYETSRRGYRYATSIGGTLTGRDGDILIIDDPLKPEEDKLTRLHAQSARIEAGHVHLPEQAPWLDDLRTELAAFPQGRHDDQVDSISQFLAWHFERMARTIRTVRLGGV